MWAGNLRENLLSASHLASGSCPQSLCSLTVVTSLSPNVVGAVVLVVTAKYLIPDKVSVKSIDAAAGYVILDTDTVGAVLS